VRPRGRRRPRRAAAQLRAFDTVRLDVPESRGITLAISRNDPAVYDATRPATGCSAGELTFSVGLSSRDIAVYARLPVT
jgi:Fibronectin type III-like domain